MSKPAIFSKDLTLFIFGYCTNKDSVFGGYKHRKSVINILNHKYGIPKYRQDGRFWGFMSNEYEAHLTEYNFHKVYLSTLNCEKVEGDEPIHHKSMFMPRGINWWLRTFDIVKKNEKKYQDLILDSIVFSCFDSPLLVNMASSRNYEEKGNFESKKVSSEEFLYPFSWHEQRPSKEEIKYLEKKYQDQEINAKITNSLKIQLSGEVIKRKFSYLNPGKKTVVEYKNEAKEVLTKRLSSPFIIETLEKKLIVEKAIFNRFKSVRDDFERDFDSLHETYKKEITRLQESLVDKEFLLDFRQQGIKIECNKETEDPYIFRYVIHILQPLESIHYRREDT